MIFRGRVQGVGFRWGTSSVAENFSVCGQVRNLPDGTVEMLAEGASSEVKAFLASLLGRMDSCIESYEVREKSGSRGFVEFTIVY